MEIKCIRCGKLIESPNASNAKYIVNPNDKRTWGKDLKEKIVKSHLSATRIQEILKNKTDVQREFITNDKGEVIRIIDHPFTRIDFEKSTEIYSDEYGRREVVIEEEVEKSKTAIVCLDCLEEGDEVIW